MSIYTSKQHRKIYEQSYGPIGKDLNGRSLEVHHIDGNHFNNHIDNLKLVTIQEHYDIHYAQGDYGACFLMINRMKLSPQEISDLASKTNDKRIKNGTHNLLGDNNPSHQRVKNGTHNFQDPKFREKHLEHQRKLVVEGKHNLQDSAMATARNLKRLAEGRDPSQVQWTCPHCNNSGRGSGAYNKWHGDKCRKKTAP